MKELYKSHNAKPDPAIDFQSVLSLYQVKGSYKGITSYLGQGKAAAESLGKSYKLIMREGEKAKFPSELLSWMQNKGIAIIEVAF